MQFNIIFPVILLSSVFLFSREGPLQEKVVLPNAANYCVQGGKTPKLILTKVLHEPPFVYIAETDSIRCSCFNLKMRTDIEFPMNPGLSLDCETDNKFYELTTCPVGTEEKRYKAFYRAEFPKEYVIPSFYLGEAPEAYIRSLHKKTISAFWEALITCSPEGTTSLQQDFNIYITGECKKAKKK